MNKKIISGLILAMAFQFCVLTGMVVNAALPLWTGKEIRIKTIPVDPRSMFRGDYARLRYEYSRLCKAQQKELSAHRTGDVVYVIFKPGNNDIYRFDTVVTQKPESGVFIRGRLETQYGGSRVKCGIEALFATGQKARQIEENMQNGGVAILMVTDSGRARIIDVVGNK